MKTMIVFWGAAYIIFLGLFYLQVLLTIPLGARDIKRLFRALNEGERSDDS